uniref:(northern house mosquito) hypothetical protein n=1 Tax=Culex pipiens TaxID=7175 RepID=A0A8D8FKR8_CULPI
MSHGYFRPITVGWTSCSRTGSRASHRICSIWQLRQPKTQKETTSTHTVNPIFHPSRRRRRRNAFQFWSTTIFLLPAVSRFERGDDVPVEFPSSATRSRNARRQRRRRFHPGSNTDCTRDSGPPT